MQMYMRAHVNAQARANVVGARKRTQAQTHSHARAGGRSADDEGTGAEASLTQLISTVFVRAVTAGVLVRALVSCARAAVLRATGTGVIG